MCRQDAVSYTHLEAGLNIGNVTYEYSSSVSAGYVISQTASPGSRVEEGTSVGYVISNGPEAEISDEPATDNGEE